MWFVDLLGSALVCLGHGGQGLHGEFDVGFQFRTEKVRLIEERFCSACLGSVLGCCSV